MVSSRLCQQAGWRTSVNMFLNVHEQTVMTMLPKLGVRIVLFTSGTIKGVKEETTGCVSLTVPPLVYRML